MVTRTTTASVDHILTSVTLSAKIYSRALQTDISDHKPYFYFCQ